MSATVTRPAGLLLIGPYPPPHGGISVHVAAIERLARRAGVPCRVLDAGGHRPADGAPNPGATAGSSAAAPDASAALAPGAGVPSRLRLLAETRRLARRSWLVHLHVSGHAAKSWLLALACGLAGAGAPGRVLTVHSGIVPEYLSGLGFGAGGAVRALVRLALGRFERVICVNEAIRDAFIELGADRARLEVAPAHLPEPAPALAPPPEIADRLLGRSPLLSTVLFFRPEYGLEVLLDALARLRSSHPALGCLVMGGGDGEAEAEARRQVVARGLDEAVVFTGDLPHPLCRALIARSDLFVRPTLADGDALSVREALALGVPVVASDAGHRPPGTVLFARGDAAGLARRIEELLDPAVAGEGAPCAEAPNGAAERLLAIYLDAAHATPPRWEATCSPS